MLPRTDLKEFTGHGRQYRELPPCTNLPLRNWSYLDVFGSNSGRWIRRSLVAAGLVISAQAKADYRVNVGDVLEVAVAGVLLPVAGLPPEIRAKIGAALTSKVFRQRTLDGREVVVVIDANEVTTVVAEYRPIYVNGDVSKPGEYP